MKKKILLFSVILILLSFFINAAIEVQDDFDRSNCNLGGASCNATNGKAWDVTAGTPVVSSNEGLWTGTANEAAILDIGIINETNNISLSWKFGATIQDIEFYEDTTVQIQMVHYLDLIQINIPGTGWTDTGCDNTENVWHTMKFVNINYTTDKFDVICDNVLQNNGGTHWPLHNTPTNLNNIKIKNRNSGSNYFVDDIEIEFISEEVINLSINNQTYNMTSDGGCIIWRNDTTENCNTTDGTPTLTFDTTNNGNCSIRATQSSSSSFLGFDSNFACGTTGGTTHICTVFFADRLLFNQNYLYASCSNGVNATSGPLYINMTAGSGGGEGLISCIKTVGAGCGAVIENNCASIIS